MNWFTTGNEKLHFARLMLEHAEVPSEGRAGDLRQPVWRQACLEAAAFHLRAAQLAWLAEVAAAHDLGDAPRATLDELLQQAAAAGVQSETLGELAGLGENPESWWNDFGRAWDQLWQGRSEAPRSAASAPEQITIASDSHQEDLLHAGLLQEFADQLESLRERQREALREW